MGEAIRNVAGLSAAALTVAFVLLASLASPRADIALQASAKCPHAAQELSAPQTEDEAGHPA